MSELTSVIRYGTLGLECAALVLLIAVSVFFRSYSDVRWLRFMLLLVLWISICTATMTTTEGLIRDTPFRANSIVRLVSVATLLWVSVTLLYSLLKGRSKGPKAANLLISKETR